MEYAKTEMPLQTEVVDLLKKSFVYDPSVHKHARQQLQQLDRGQTTQVLSAVLNGEIEVDDTDLRYRAADMLTRLAPKQAQTLLLPCLKSQDRYMRSTVCGCLGDCGNEEATMPLVDVLRNDPVADIRMLAAWSLGKVGDRRAIPALRWAVQHDEGEDWEGHTVEESATDAIQEIMERHPSQQKCSDNGHWQVAGQIGLERELIMHNLHLLQIELGVGEYEATMARSYRRDIVDPFQQLPAYLIARCPFCSMQNIEKLNTYTLESWTVSLGTAAFHPQGVLRHCPHFALVQTFFHFHGIWPAEAKGLFGPEKPYVIGYLLDSGQCLAAIHALPVCRIEDGAFVPRYTLLMVSYFSERPQEAYDTVIETNRPRMEYGLNRAFLDPEPDKGHWWDLSSWVSTGKLFWVDGGDPLLPLRGDVEAFPYASITGRDYFHRFPYPLPKPRSSGTKR